MVLRTVLCLALLVASCSGLRGSRRNAPSSATKIPAWACSLKAGPAAFKNAGIFSSGNATEDAEDSKAIEKIAEFREKVTEQDEKKLLKEATLGTELAKKESELSADLAKKAKAEETKDPKAWEKDGKASLKAITDGEKAAKGAKKAMDEEKAEAKATKAATEKWEEDASVLKAFAVVEKAKLQKVEAVDGKSLAAQVAKKEKDLLIFFYAPWCPHCQTFVMHDENGNPKKAPLELFRTELEKNGALKTLSVLKYDTQADGNIPKQFDVQYLPTAYLATATGTVVAFEGNPHDLAALRAFVKTHAPKTQGI